MEIKLVSTLGNQNLLRLLTRKDGKPSYTYVLITDNPDKIRVGYFKDGLEKSTTISHIDAPGGPRMTVGKTIKNTELPAIERIEYNKQSRKYIITFKQ
jgi:hypothetical protein